MVTTFASRLIKNDTVASLIVRFDKISRAQHELIDEVLNAQVDTRTGNNLCVVKSKQAGFTSVMQSIAWTTLGCGLRVLWVAPKFNMIPRKWGDSSRAGLTATSYPTLASDINSMRPYDLIVLDEANFMPVTRALGIVRGVTREDTLTVVGSSLSASRGDDLEFVNMFRAASRKHVMRPDLEELCAKFDTMAPPVSFLREQMCLLDAGEV